MRSFKDHLIAQGTPIKEALLRLNKLASDAILFVVDNEERLVGSLTDGDIRRGLLRGITINSNVDVVIQDNPKFIKKGNYDLGKIINYRKDNYKVIPVVDEQTKVVNVINFRVHKSYLPIDAIIMAGGKGTRLRPLTENMPKPLLKVGDKPIIEHNLDRLALFGIDDFWISINYLGDQIVQFLGDGSNKSINIDYVSETKPLGTIGAVSQIGNLKHDTILLTNSDILTNLDYEDFYLDFVENDADMSIATIPYNVNVPYAVLETSNGHVLNLREKPTFTYYSNGGIYLIKKDALENIPEGQHYNATDLIEELIEQDKKVISYPLLGYWLDIGKHEDFKKAQIDINQVKF